MTFVPDWRQEVIHLLLIMALIILCGVMVWYFAQPASALTISDREQIGYRYGLNPIYLRSSALPGAHTVTSLTLDILVLDGIDPVLVRESTKYINPFYKFRFIGEDPAKYRRYNDGLIYSNDIKTIVISDNRGKCSKCGCGSSGLCCPVSIWIDQDQPLTPKQLGNLIEHECDHLIGRSDEETGRDLNLTSRQITDRYSESSRTWGTVTITRINGSGSYSWEVTI